MTNNGLRKDARMLRLTAARPGARGATQATTSMVRFARPAGSLLVLATTCVLAVAMRSAAAERDGCGEQSQAHGSLCVCADDATCIGPSCATRHSRGKMLQAFNTRCTDCSCSSAHSPAENEEIAKRYATYAGAVAAGLPARPTCPAGAPPPRACTVCSLGAPPWQPSSLAENLDDFVSSIYLKRPGNGNAGGGSLFQYYALYSMIKALRPKHIIESGAFKGVGTWFLRQAAGPNVQLVVVSPENPSIYRDPAGRYFTGKDFQDFAKIDWCSVLDPAETLLFIDDHQSGVRRMQEAHARGFRHMAFDDNYIPGLGDNLAGKKVCSSEAHKLMGAPYREQDNFDNSAGRALTPTDYLERQARFNAVVDVYAEFPPAWDGINRFKIPDDKYKALTLPPILSAAQTDTFAVRHGLDTPFESSKYTHISYVGIKPNPSSKC